MAVLELGASVYGKLKQVAARQQAGGLYAWMTEELVLTIPAQQLDQAQQQKLSAVNQWLQANQP